MIINGHLKDSSNGLPVISASKIKTYKTCARKFYHTYIERSEDRDSKNIGAIMGTALHEAIEAKYRKQTDNAVYYFQERFIELYNQGSSKGDQFFTSMLKLGKTIINGYDWDKWTPSASVCFNHDENCRDHKEVELMLELEVYLEYPNKDAPLFIIHGFIDMITFDECIVDHKSSKDKPTTDTLNNDAQFILYTWMYQEIFGKLPNKVIWNHLRTHEQFEFDMTDLNSRMNMLVRDIDSLFTTGRFINDYPRINIDKKECLKYCAFKHKCFYLSGNESSNIEE